MTRSIGERLAARIHGARIAQFGLMSLPKCCATGLPGRLIRQCHGQDLIEYAVLIALVAAGVIVAASQLGVKVPGLYEPTVAALPGEPGRGGNPGNGNPGNGNPVGNPGSGNPGGGRGK